VARAEVQIPSSCRRVTCRQRASSCRYHSGDNLHGAAVGVNGRIWCHLQIRRTEPVHRSPSGNIIHPMTDEDAFLQTILTSPHDPSPKLVFADWLEERGDPRAELIRLLHALTQSIDVPGRDQMEERMRGLLEAGGAVRDEQPRDEVRPDTAWHVYDGKSEG
jgi:uncharacterized protein (TIGR02996 family)